MSLDKGKKAERDVANYLTSNGIPARRDVRTGSRTHHDTGDITFEHVCIEVKNYSGNLTMGNVRTMLAKLEIQKKLGDFGFLVDRLDNVGDSGSWRVWMTSADAVRLLVDRAQLGAITWADDTEPVSMRLAYVVHRLKAGGWCEIVNPFSVG